MACGWLWVVARFPFKLMEGPKSQAIPRAASKHLIRMGSSGVFVGFERPIERNQLSDLL